MNPRTPSTALLATMVALLGVGATTAPAASIITTGGSVYIETIKAEAEGSIALSGSITVTCGKSTFEGPVESHGTEVPVEVTLSSLTLSECGSHTVTVIKPGVLELHETSEGDGTLTSTGAELTVLMHSVLLGTVHCIYTTKNTDIGDVTGGAPATLDIGSAPISRTTTDFACGSHSTLEGSYKVTTPATLEVAGLAQVPDAGKPSLFEFKEGQEKVIDVEDVMGKVDWTLEKVDVQIFSGGWSLKEDLDCLNQSVKAAQGYICNVKIKCLESGAAGTWQARFRIHAVWGEPEKKGIWLSRMKCS
jgi:hypothetical protein